MKRGRIQVMEIVGMTITQEFLVINSEDGSIGVFGVGRLPAGTVVSGDARRLRVVGQSLVTPPRDLLSGVEWDRWHRELKDNGYRVEEGPFWR